MGRDSQLIQQIIKKGSHEAAQELIEGHYDDLYNFLYYQVHHREDALDLTQETFIGALNSLANYDASKAGFRTWLYRIGTYKVIDFRRQKRVTTMMLPEDGVVDERDLSADFLQRELLGEINDYVAFYQGNYQAVFRLRIYGKLSFPEIASLLGEKEEKVKAQYYRLIKRVREEFEANVSSITKTNSRKRS